MSVACDVIPHDFAQLDFGYGEDNRKIEKIDD